VAILKAKAEQAMLKYLTAITLFDVAGDFIQSTARLPIPGPVIGMALLLLALIGKGSLPDGLDRAATGILSYLPMLFVPAGVGIMVHFDLIRAEWPAITVAIGLSSVLTIVVTATTMRSVERLQQATRKRRDEITESAG
jgi:holin-like protein